MTVSEQYILEHVDEAIVEHHIKAYFQPIIRTLTGDICCAEALARWVDPDLGLLSPTDFISVLEKYDRVYEVDLSILRQTCAFYRKLQADGTPVHSFSVNFSRYDFSRPRFFEDVVGIVDEYGVPHEVIKLEVTEGVLFENEKLFRQAFYAFQNAGFIVWLDDFGTGYSSLGMLQGYSFDLLKIDMLFMKDFTDRSRQLVSAIVNMAKALNMLSLIEGVETEEQLEFVRTIGCDSIQGFYYAKPMSGEAFVNYLSERRIEPQSEKHYWNTVCGFNLLSSNPFEDANAAHPFQSDIPLALIEVTWGRGDYIYANDAYLESVRSLGFDSIQALEHFFNDKVSLNYNPMKNLLADAVLKNAVQEIDYISGNVLYKFRARCIAKSAALNKAMVVASLSTFREGGEIHDRGELMHYSQALYASYEHVNLVFPDRDSSIRVFSKANFQTAHQFLGLRAGIRSFSEKEVLPEDADRYRRFFDMDTLEQRTAGKGYIQQAFRIHNADGRYEWRQVRITKIPSVLDNMYLYTIQTMSDVSIRIAEMLVRDHPEMLE